MACCMRWLFLILWKVSLTNTDTQIQSEGLILKLILPGMHWSILVEPC